VYKTIWQRQTKREGKLTTGKETDRQGDNYKKDLICRISLQKAPIKEIQKQTQKYIQEETRCMLGRCGKSEKDKIDIYIR
jgi:hypothetical protein